MEGSHSTLLQDIGLCVVAATVLAFAARILRQPLLLAYIGAGILIGPIGLEWVKEQSSIALLAELGLALLMFIVGLEIDLKKLAAAGKPATITTLVQVTAAIVLCWITARLLGYVGMPAAYIAVAGAFSSTMIVIKLLNDRGEIDTLPGQLTLGVLLLQDVIAIVVLAIQPSIGGGVSIGALLLPCVKGIGLVIGTLAISRWILPTLFRLIAMTPELVVLSAISWCLMVCFAAVWLQFSLAMGALIAGVSISALPYSLDVIAKIRGLRDFFVTLFFVSLGMLLVKPTWELVLHALALSGVVIVSRFVSVWPALRALKFDNRVSILSSIHLSQSSEFGLVVALTGLALQHIGTDIVSLIVIVLVVTSTISTYMITFSHSIALFLSRQSNKTPLVDRHSAGSEKHESHAAEIMLIGCFRVGEALVSELHKRGADFSVVDFNPALHEKLKAMGVRCTYGDISHHDTLAHAGVKDARVLVSSISDDFLRGTSNATLLESLRRINPKARIIVTAETEELAEELRQRGADHVIVPPVLSAGELARLVDQSRRNE